MLIGLWIFNTFLREKKELIFCKHLTICLKIKIAAINMDLTIQKLIQPPKLEKWTTLPSSLSFWDLLVLVPHSQAKIFCPSSVKVLSAQLDVAPKLAGSAAQTTFTVPQPLLTARPAKVQLKD